MRAKYRRAQAHARVSLLRRSLRALYSYLNSLPHKRPLAFVKSSTATILDRVAVRARAAPLLPAASAHSRFSPPPSARPEAISSGHEAGSPPHLSVAAAGRIACTRRPR